MEIIKVKIKQFNSPEQKKEAQRVVKEQGLKEFNSLAPQHTMIPEGVYQIDLGTVFADQYNTTGKRRYRIFEYDEVLSVDCARPQGRGYYIAEGIEKIREYQKHLKVCGYCGKQYYKSDQEWCFACVGSEYLTPDCYKLLRLVNVCNRIKYKYPVTVSADFRAIIREAQRKTRQKKLRQAKKDTLAACHQKIKSAQKEHRAFQWLIDQDIAFDNCIYYDHTGVFCFGWRTSLTDTQKRKLKKALVEFPFKYELK